MQLFMPKKKHRIPPLTQKDIIVAELDSRDSIDRTEQYRQMIAKKHHPLDISSEEDAINRARTQTEKLKLLRVDNLGVPHELQKQATEENRLVSEFTSLNINFDPDTDLHEMVLKLQKRVNFYTDKETKTADALQKLYKHFHSSTVEGRVSVDKASSNSQILYEKIILTRRSYQQMREKLVDNSLKINKLIIKSRNVESVLQIIEIWKKTILGKLSEFSSNQKEKDLLSMLRTVGEVKDSFQTEAKDYKEYGCFLKMEQFLNKKKEGIIKEIESNYERRIIDFNESKYIQQVQTYQKLLEQNAQSKRITTLSLLDRNLTQILKSSYKESYNQDINMITNEQYIEFISELTSHIEQYCRNWHLTTRLHIQYINQNNKQEQSVINQQGKEYLRFRKVIFQKIQERICDIISKTYTFYKFTVVQRSIFILKVHKLFLEVSLFARQTPKLIGEVIKKKCKEERQIMEKGYQSWLKHLIISQIKIPLFQVQNEPRPFDSGELLEFSDEERKIVEEFQNNKLNINFQEAETSPLAYGNRKHVINSSAPLPEISEFSSSLLICQFTKQITKRIYFNSKIGVEMFNKLKEMLELQIISIYCGCCPQQIQKQLQDDWSKFSSIKVLKYDDIEANIPKIEYYKECQRLQSEYYQLSVQIPSLLNKFPITIPNAVVLPSIQVKGELLENLTVTHRWIQTNFYLIFTKEIEKKAIQSMQQELRLLQLLIKQLISIIHSTIIEDTKFKYDGFASSVKDLKWEIKKYNNQTSELFKSYKNNYFCIFQSQILSLKINQMSPEIKKAVETSLVNDFFKALTQAYAKIEKINSNGRQLMRLDALQLEERIKAFGVSTDNTFIRHLLKFIQLGFESEAVKLEAGIKLQLPIFPFKVWKPFLVSCKAADQISWVERRDFLLRLAQYYLSVVAAGQLK